MSLLSLSVTAVIMAVMCIQLKKLSPEYGTLLSIGACLLIMCYIILKITRIMDYVEELTENINIDIIYIEIIFKMIGIAYICEFASCLCRDAGCSAIASQIEIAAKVSMVLISVPILLSVINMISSLLA